MSYYIAVGSEQKGPFPVDQLLAQGLMPETMVWTDGMGQWSRADTVPALALLFASAASSGQPVGYATPTGYPNAGAPSAYSGPVGAVKSPEMQQAANMKLAAGLCALLIGSLGIHKFVMGRTHAGVIMILCCCTCIGLPVMHIIAIIEGIIYLTKSDAEFYQIYMVEKKAWF